MGGEDQTPVIVLGSGVTQLGVVRVLGRAGIPSLTVSAADDLVRHSRWYVAAPDRGSDEPLSDYLERFPHDRAVVLACSDIATVEVAALPPELRQRFAASVPSSATLDLLVDKLGFAKLLQELSVPHPYTQEISGPHDLARVPPRAFDEGSFLKPRDSQRFFAHFGVKAFRVGSRRDAETRLAEIRAAGFEVVLQEYVPGSSDEHYFVDGFRDAQGKVRVRFARRRVRMFPPDFGNSTCTVSVPLDEAAGAVRSMDAILEGTHYHGVFSAEFKRDARDGEFKILEVNARPWWYVEFAARAGADVVTRYYRDALGLPVADAPPYEVGAACIYPYYDYFACRPLRRAGTMSLLRMLGAWSRAYQPIFTLDDPGPSLWEARRFVARRPRRGGR